MNAVTNDTVTITIKYDNEKDTLTVHPDGERYNINKVKKVKWQCEGNEMTDWRVIFGAYAPVYKEGEPKVASRDHPVLQLKKNRAEDLGHWKYVVVAKIEGKEDLRHLDPELVVDDND